MISGSISVLYCSTDRVPVNLIVENHRSWQCPILVSRFQCDKHLPQDTCLQPLWLRVPCSGFNSSSSFSPFNSYDFSWSTKNSSPIFVWIQQCLKNTCSDLAEISLNCNRRVPQKKVTSPTLKMQVKYMLFWKEKSCFIPLYLLN